jgi:hypothetical protein
MLVRRAMQRMAFGWCWKNVVCCRRLISPHGIRARPVHSPVLRRKISVQRNRDQSDNKQRPLCFSI